MKQKSLLLAALFSTSAIQSPAQTSVYYGADLELTTFQSVSSVFSAPTLDWPSDALSYANADYTTWSPGITLDLAWKHFNYVSARIDEVEQLGNFIVAGGGISSARLVPRFVLFDPPLPLQQHYLGRLLYISYYDSAHGLSGGADGVDPQFQVLTGAIQHGLASSGPNLAELGIYTLSFAIFGNQVIDPNLIVLPGYRRLVYQADSNLGYVARPLFYSTLLTETRCQLSNALVYPYTGPIGLGPAMGGGTEVYHGLKFTLHEFGVFPDPPTWIVVTDVTIGPSIPVLNVIIKEAATLTPQYSTVVELNGTQGGWLDYPPASGSYVAYIRIRGGLGLNVPISSSGSSNTPIQLRLGDADGDNEIGPSDFAAVSSHLGKFDTDPDWFVPNANGVSPEFCDFDDDGEVGPADAAYVSMNFGEFGD